jgi:hypothetical protein
MSAPFTLENGGAQLAAVFRDVTRIDYEDALHLTEVEPALAYVGSLPGAATVSTDRLERLRAELAAEIRARGFVHVRKISGAFIARDPRP